MIKLSDVCEFIVDCPHSTAKDEGEGYPLIRTPNIGKGRLLLQGVHRVSESVYNNRIARAAPQDNDLIFAREAPAGNVAIIKKGEKVCLGQRTVLLRPNKKLVNPDFLTYFLLAPEQQYGLLGTANGATVAHVNIPTIRELKIQLPPLEKQNKIAAIITVYDDLIENNQKQIKLLEEAAQRLYKEWFVDLRFPGHETTPIIEGIPRGWNQGMLGDVLKESGKKISKEKREGYTYYLPIDCLPKKSLGYVSTNDISLAESSLVAFDPGDIIFGAMRPYFHKVVVARDSGITRTTCFVLNADKPAYWAYAVMLMFYSDTVDYATQISVGTTMPYARWKDFKRMPVVIPSVECAIAFDKEIVPIITKINGLSKQIILLQQARDRLLPKLMNGEIEV